MIDESTTKEVANPETSSDYSIWNYGNLKIYYKPALDNAASSLVRAIIKFFHQHCRYQSFPRLLEWQCSAGFIGFPLLADGFCDHLVLSDPNPENIACIKRTIEENNLSELVTVYQSEGLQNIPTTEKFDLVLGNPPHYVNLNKKHPLGHKNYLSKLAHDPEWQLHREFYAAVKEYLNFGAHVFTSEIEPFKQTIYFPKDERTPYEVRHTVPIEDFKDMMSDGGLIYLDSLPFFTTLDDITFWMVCSKRQARLWQRLFTQVNVLKS